MKLVFNECTAKGVHDMGFFEEAVEVLELLVEALAKSRGEDFFLCPTGIFYEEAFEVKNTLAYALVVREPIRLYLYVPP